jgi:hypothetical protein
MYSTCATSAELCGAVYACAQGTWLYGTPTQVLLFQVFGLLSVVIVCMQVSNAQVGKLARLAAGRPADTTSSSNGNGNGSSSSGGPELIMDDFRHSADAAYAAVDVPDSVIDILAELRCYLQVRGHPWCLVRKQGGRQAGVMGFFGLKG